MFCRVNRKRKTSSCSRICINVKLDCDAPSEMKLFIKRLSALRDQLRQP